ncbi:zinc transporter 4 isoform X2 [Stegostoma tigrinum]|uniref:zinc transporter 4 isoform X2 n=1 Tax=Stegostoma tigrinum TaxID=3053191 RepID=UPI002870006A|nr:zinc transporter 4 isoform X2 [Stegostoma tigrinum]
MARPPWRCFSSFLREERASSVDTAGLALPEAIGEEDEDELPALSGANQLRMVLQDEAAICNGAGADSNPEPGAGLPEELPPDTAANEQTCHRCSKTSESVRQKTVRRKLWIAMTLYSVFTAGEFIEALAAVLSVMLIYAVTIGLIYEAVQRTIHKDFEIQADVMIIIAAIGVAVNLIMGVLLNQSSHMHSHARCQSEPAARGDQRNNTNHSHKAGSLAVRAAFIHALGDLVQSIGVLMAAYIIRFKPQYKIADPICTYIFSFLVLCTTFPILRDTSLIFLEGTPRHLDVHRLRDTLLKIDDVHSVQRLNVWSLTVGKTAAIVHLKLIPESFSRWEDVQCQVQQIMLYTFGMHQCTVQVQVFKETGNNACNKCRSLQA